MNLIALKILIGDRAKYIGLIFGIIFATFLMSQQMSLFVGIMSRTFSIVEQIDEVDIWVMDPKVQYIDGIEPIPDINLARVRGVDGVKRATKFFKGNVVAKVNSMLQMVTLIGPDDVSFIGAPQKMIMGNVADLKKPNAVIIDETGYKYIWPNEPFQINREFEANDQRMNLVGIADTVPAFSSPVLIYSLYSNAINYSGASRNKLSFVLVDVEDGKNAKEVAKNITKRTGLKALTAKEFKFETLKYYMTHTGIAINFGVTVMLGFLVGAAISGQTFYIFINENLRQFAVLKAVGVNNRQILLMVLLQALTVATIGYAIGIGLTSIFFIKVAASTATFKGFILPWQVVAIVFVAIISIMTIISFFSIRKVVATDPSLVFRN